MRLNSRERLIWLTVLLALLYKLPYDQLEGYSVFWISCILAIPIYHYRINYRLFARRAIIATGCTESGKAKRWLWNGGFLRISNCITSVVISYFVILTASLLTSHEWLVVISSALLLILLEASTQDFAERESVARFLPIFHRETIKIPIFIWVVVASSLLYINADQENLVEQDVIQLAKDRFNGSFNSFESSVFGFSRGLLLSIDGAVSTLAQQYIPRIEQTWAKALSWLYLSVKSSVAAGLIVYLMLGVLTVVTEKERQGWLILGRTIFDKSFTLTLLALFVLSIYISNISTMPRNLPNVSSGVDCTSIIAEYQQAAEKRTRSLEAEEALLESGVSTSINSGLDLAFSNLESGIDSYLDWHFSVTGQYQALGARLFSSLPNHQQKIEEFVTRGVGNRLTLVNQGITSDIDAELKNSFDSTEVQLSSLQQRSECPINFTSSSELKSETGISLLKPIGVGQPQFALATTGIVSAVVAKKAAAKVAAKTATKLGSKVIASLGSGVLVGSVCGPLVAVCGGVTAIGSWFAVDKVMVEYEEASERTEMRQDILVELAKEKEALRTRLMTFYAGAIAAEYDRITPSFNVLNDGIR
jgi:hypothetical protein